ncbi:hypothetical protein DCAR_0626319 [Daucus carota subsp. sativus]|uniref:Transmembrane protein n=1 Tax=Daucus carota subsp. sativus TaxID=79200 RepID=A0AAF1B5G6_DAUCS|nr:PREDICTED: uncharacterized protein LOC108224946 [Daucus carota subsp. sativus]WOH06890.1 hypothetical protein DCAR_0626319 [Daucus carota subsp. sativus]
MSFASSQQSFLINSLSSTHYPLSKTSLITPNKSIFISCKHKPSDSTASIRKSYEEKLGKLAMVTLAAGILTLGTFDPALAAKSGGRVGGQAFRSSRPAAPPRASSPRTNNSRTNIYINPPVAPPLSGYGYGYGYGGYGWSPFSFFAPGPSVAVGIGGGFDTLAFFLFLGAGAAVVRRLFRSRDDDDY